MTNKVYWQHVVHSCDLCGSPLREIFVDGRVHGGSSWAIHCSGCWGVRRTGVGLGQMYRRQEDGKWLRLDLDTPALKG